MAVQTINICDVCQAIGEPAEPAVEEVKIQFNGRKGTLDLCGFHLGEVAGWAKMKPSRRDVALAVASAHAEVATLRPGRRKKTTAKGRKARRPMAKTKVCKACGYGPTSGTGLSAHQRATGHKGVVEA